jgi:hypothetical protein
MEVIGMVSKNIQQIRLGSEYMERWYEILCDTPEREKEFVERFYEDSKWVLMPLCRYRAYQIQQGRGQNITAQELAQTKEEDKLIYKLQEIFLYPVYKSTLKLMKETFINYEELLRLHNKYIEYSLEKLALDYKNKFID